MNLIQMRHLSDSLIEYHDTTIEQTLESQLTREEIDNQLFFHLKTISLCHNSSNDFDRNQFKQTFDYNLTKRPSTIPNAGSGLINHTTSLYTYIHHNHISFC